MGAQREDINSRRLKTAQLHAERAYLRQKSPATRCLPRVSEVAVT